ncbi:Transcription initiation factor TFIID subunit 2 [Zea mays]|uniref:Transcription initiation factor TFIID subunit 2 n=1 Tax=Zea mays TaxID=4577 RepID=A0A3L6GDE9_MAIZE|nr:Transcription initiation factor TFIID subunit 2 [Zea mays]
MGKDRPERSVRYLGSKKHQSLPAPKFKRTQLLRLLRNKSKNNKGRKKLLKLFDTGFVATVEVLAILRQGLLVRYQITRNWYMAYPDHKACPMMFLHMMLLMKFPFLTTGVLFMSSSFGCSVEKEKENEKEEEEENGNEKSKETGNETEYEKVKNIKLVHIDYILEKAETGIQFVGNVMRSSSQIRRAHCWFPCVDSARERCPFDLEFTVSMDFIAVSNGDLLYQVLINLFFLCYDDYLSAPFPLGLYKHIFLPSEMTILPASLGASTCILSSDILHDEKVIDQVCLFLLFYYPVPSDLDQ